MEIIKDLVVEKLGQRSPSTKGTRRRKLRPIRFHPRRVRHLIWHQLKFHIINTLKYLVFLTNKLCLLLLRIKFLFFSIISILKGTNSKIGNKIRISQRLIVKVNQRWSPFQLIMIKYFHTSSVKNGK